MAEKPETPPKRRSGSPAKGSEADPEQYERFLEAARGLGCDESGEAFERALDRILPPRKPGEPAPRREERPQPKGSRRRTKGAG